MKRETPGAYGVEDAAKKQRTQVQGYSFSGEFASAYGTSAYGQAYMNPMYANPYGMIPQAPPSQYGVAAVAQAEPTYFNGTSGSRYGTQYRPLQPGMVAYSQVPTFPVGYQQTYAAPLNLGYAPQPQDAINPDNRTIYLGGIPDGTTAEEILNHVKTGMVEAIRFLPEKNTAFVAFVEASAANQFMTFFNSGTHEFVIRDQNVVIRYGKPSPLSHPIARAVEAGSSRCVYLGNLDDNVTSEQLLTEVSTFGEIDTIKIVAEKRCAFVHFFSISAALNCVNSLPSNENWTTKRVSFGKDRCNPSGKVPKANPFPQGAPGYGQFQNFGSFQEETVPDMRQVYIGGLAPGTTTADICNVVRGGMLLSVRIVPEKNCGFVTFVETAAAAHFLNFSQTRGVWIKAKRASVNWAKPQTLPNIVRKALPSGASRNIVLATPKETTTEETLRKDLGEFGVLEQVFIKEDKSFAYVNFNNIVDAINAFEALSINSNYIELGIRYGKDRCANMNVSKPSNHTVQQPYQSYEVTANPILVPSVAPIGPIQPQPDV